MAEKLVLGMSASFDPEQFEDDYRRDLMKLIHKKARAGELNSVPEKTTKKRKTEKTAQVIDLSALLRESVESKGGRRSAKHRKSA